MIAMMGNDLNDGVWGFGLGCVVGCLGCPSRLSSPVTLTLALSRRAGEGRAPLALDAVRFALSGFPRSRE